MLIGPCADSPDPNALLETQQDGLSRDAVCDAVTFLTWRESSLPVKVGGGLDGEVNAAFLLLVADEMLLTASLRRMIFSHHVAGQLEKKSLL